MLAKAYEATAEVLAAVEDWQAPSPCEGWTVRDVGAHLVDVMCTFASAVDGGPDTYEGDVVAGYREAAARCLAVFEDPAVLVASHPFPFGPTPGSVIAHISMSESLVHGWDVARGVGFPYSPSQEVVHAVLMAADGSIPVPEGMFAPPVEPTSDEPMTVLLARLGRTA